jgi:hypothetical protein
MGNKMLSISSDNIVAAGITCPRKRRDQILQYHTERVTVRREQSELLLSETKNFPEVVKNSVTIPSLPHQASAIPAQWARSSLFTNPKPGTEKNLLKHLLENRGGYKISMTGRQLNIHDNDVYLQAIRIAQTLPAGEPVFFKRSTFLRTLGKSDGKNEYDDLLQSFKKLRSATIFIEKGTKSFDCNSKGFNLFQDFSWDDLCGYSFTLSPLAVKFFNNGENSYIDMQARLKLKKPLSKWLQNFLSSHDYGPRRVFIVDLMRLSGAVGRTNDFVRRSLPLSLDEIKAAGLITRFAIEKNKGGQHVMIWNRNPHHMSKRAFN